MKAEIDYDIPQKLFRAKLWDGASLADESEIALAG